jgi:hypothetical protein
MFNNNNYNRQLCKQGIHFPNYNGDVSSDIDDSDDSDEDNNVTANCTCNCTNDDNTIFLFHDKSNCQMEYHMNYKSQCYVKFEKPMWKHSCCNEFDTMTSDMIDYFVSLFNIKCTCTTQHTCRFCFFILGQVYDSLFTIDKSVTSYIPLWVLQKLYTHLQTNNSINTTIN